MVKEVKAYQDEITGKIFNDRYKAQKSEEKSKKKLEVKEIEDYAEEVAKKFGFKDFYELRNYVGGNSDKIKSLGVRMRIDVLALKGPSHFSIKDIKEGLETLIEKALFEIRDEVVTVIINLDNKQISTFQTKDYKNAKLEFEGHSLIKHYLESIENQKNTYICNFKSYPEKEVIPFVEALKQFNITKDYNFDRMVRDYIEKPELSAEEKYYALEAEGVDNWSGYSYTIEMAEEDGDDWFDMSPAEKYYALECAGVDNWHGYEYAFETKDEDITDEVIEECFKDNQNYFAKNWKNYKDFKFALHGLK